MNLAPPPRINAAVNCPTHLPADSLQTRIQSCLGSEFWSGDLGVSEREEEQRTKPGSTLELARSEGGEVG